MRADEIIIESPQMVEPTDFNLNNETSNREILRDLLKKKREVYIDDVDYEIFITGDHEKGSVVLWDKKEELIGYYVKLETKRHSFIGETVTQVALWRSPMIGSAVGKTSQIFFNYLLQNWETVMSDGQQTEKGREFWITRMAEADIKGYSVGVAHLIDKVMIWKKPDETFAAWIRKEAKNWGDTNYHRSLRFLISNRDPHTAE